MITLHEKIAKAMALHPLIIEAYHGGMALEGGGFSTKFARTPNDFFGGGVAYFTSDQNIAQQYAIAAHKRSGEETYVYKVSLKFKNIFDVGHRYTGPMLVSMVKDPEQFARAAGMLKLGADKFRVISGLKSGTIQVTGEQLWKGLSLDNRNTDLARKTLIKAGFDGLRYNGGQNFAIAKGGVEHDVYLPYGAKQIKVLQKWPFE